MSDLPGRLLALSEAAGVLGDGVTASQVKARIHRGSLDGVKDASGEWYVSIESLEQSLTGIPPCGGCGEPVTEMVIVKYPHHDRVEFELCGEHAAQTVIAYGRQGQVLEVASYPYQSEGWLKPRP